MLNDHAESDLSPIGLRSDSAWSLSISEGPETEKEKL